ncbi:MAG: outer membrane beta-barrel protein [Methylobacter sp.]
MKIINTLACTALLASGSAFAQQEAHEIEFLLGGTVKTSRFFDDNDGGINAQLGYYLTQQLELSGRQYGFINSSNGSTSVQGASGLFTDYHVDLGIFQPFVGVGGLFNYGSNQQSNSFDVGAEAGIKAFVMPQTFVSAQGTYLRPVDDFGNGHKSYALFSLGVGFTF